MEMSVWNKQKLKSLNYKIWKLIAHGKPTFRSLRRLCDLDLDDKLNKLHTALSDHLTLMLQNLPWLATDNQTKYNEVQSPLAEYCDIQDPNLLSNPFFMLPCVSPMSSNDG